MRNKTYIVFTALLVTAAFILGGYLFHPNSVVPEFTIYHDDQLCVTRILSGDKWISIDSTLVVNINYLQIGENERAYQLVLSSQSNAYHGFAYYYSFYQKYCFVDPNCEQLIELYEDTTQAYLHFGNDTIQLIRQWEILE